MKVPLTISVNCRMARTLLTAIVASLIACHLVTQGLYLYMGKNYQLGFRRLLNLGEEANLPTWYSSCSLALCSALLFVVGSTARSKKGAFAHHWLVLAGIFLFLSVDEGAMLHEATMLPLDPLVARFGYFGGYLYDAWLIPWGLFVAFVGISYVRFLGHLPSDIRLRFIVAGTLFVGGAAGTELFEGRVDYLAGGYSDARIPIVTLQEVMELLGVLVFLRALLTHVSRVVGDLTVTFVDS